MDRWRGLVKERKHIMAETEIAKTTDVEQPGAGAFQRHFDSIQVACEPAPPLWPSMETPEAAEAREAQGLPPPPPFKVVKYDHSRKEAAAAGPHRQGQAAAAHQEPHRATIQPATRR
jgi:hypothetical protein